MSLENYTRSELLYIGYTLLDIGLYKTSIDIFSKLKNVPLINGTENVIIKRLRKNIGKLKQMKENGKITKESYRNIISDYGAQYKYAKRKEEEIYNKLHRGPA